MPGYTYDELTKVPFVMKVVREYRGPGTTMQRFYGLGMGQAPGQVLPQRSGVYDIFNPTRSFPIARAPMTGPARVARKPVGQKIISLPRFFEAVAIEDELVFRNRPMGGQYGTVDQGGQTYIGRQYQHEITKFANLHEFMASAMFRGGWALKPYGEDLIPVPKGTAGATITFDTLVPSEHQSQLAIDTGGADVIDTSWDDPTADIHSQLLKLNKIHAARHGAPLKHIWLNGSTIAPLFNNTKLQAIGGSVYRIWDERTGVEKNPDEPYPDTGIKVKFRALPEYTFHVYNQVVVPDLVAETKSAQLDPSNYYYLIPDNEIILTPEPGPWCELVAGSEPMQYSKQEQPKIVSGFDTGRAREIFPPRWDMMFWACQAPILVEDLAVYNPTVIFA